MELVLQNCLKPTQNMINNLIDVELGYININHPDFASVPEYLNGVCKTNTNNI